MNYRFTPDARDDLVTAISFYESQREGLGAELAVEIGVGIARILDAPMRWPQIERNVRKYTIDRFPYGIFYRVPDARNVEIIAVFDLRRRPGDWRRGQP